MVDEVLDGCADRKQPKRRRVRISSLDTQQLQLLNSVDNVHKGLRGGDRLFQTPQRAYMRQSCRPPLSLPHHEYDIIHDRKTYPLQLSGPDSKAKVHSPRKK